MSGSDLPRCVVDWSGPDEDTGILGIRQGRGGHRMLPYRVLQDHCRKHIRRSGHVSAAPRLHRLLLDAGALPFCTAVESPECRMGGKSASIYEIILVRENT